VLRRVVREGIMSAGAVVLLLLALIAIDDRVREQLSLRFAERPRVELAEAGKRVKSLTAVVVEAAHDQSVEHAPLFIFVLGATVLVLFMLRT